MPPAAQDYQALNGGVGLFFVCLEGNYLANLARYMEAPSGFSIGFHVDLATQMSDIPGDLPGDPGSQLPYQEFLSYYLAPIWLVFPDPGGFGGWGVLASFPSSLCIIIKQTHDKEARCSNLTHQTAL